MPPAYETERLLVLSAAVAVIGLAKLLLLLASNTTPSEVKKSLGITLVALKGIPNGKVAIT